MLLTRRYFFRWLLGLSLLPLFPFRIRQVEAVSSPSPAPGPEKTHSIGEFFDGEELVYEIGLWMLKRIALGRLSFKKMEGRNRYTATLQAETQGVLGWVARYRVDTYRSEMEETQGGRRLRALSFEEDVKVGSKLRKKTHLFDYDKRKWIVTRRRKDGGIEKTEEEIPREKIYDDFLTASYNFRFGVYGQIERGKTYSVATFPRKGSTHYEVRVASREEEEKKRKAEKSRDGKEFFLRLFLSPEITHSKEGLIEGWLSRELYPTEGTLKDVLLFGDVRGTLIKNARG